MNKTIGDCCGGFADGGTPVKGKAGSQSGVTLEQDPVYAEEYKPSWRDRVAQALMGDEQPTMEWERLVQGLTGSQGLGNETFSALDFVPGVGQAMLGADALDYAASGNVPAAVVSGAAMAIPYGIGKATGRFFRAADQAARYPNAESTAAEARRLSDDHFRNMGDKLPGQNQGSGGWGEADLANLRRYFQVNPEEALRQPVASGPPASADVSRYLNALTNSGTVPPTIPRLSPGHAESPVARRYGMDIDAADILQSWKPGKDYLPNSAGGVVRRATGGVVETPLDGSVVVGPLKAAFGRGGRTDDMAVSVKSGSFVVPADIVSGMGQGSSDAGHRFFAQLGRKAPYGVKPYSGPKGKGKLAGSSTSTKTTSKTYAQGGEVDEGTVPILAAVDEHVLDPEQIYNIGHGDMDLGHRLMDQFVVKRRAEIIKEMAALPPPAR